MILVFTSPLINGNINMYVNLYRGDGAARQHRGAALNYPGT